MATLELVRLRSVYPNTGHITLRHAAPVIDPPTPFDLLVEDILDSFETSTTPQVAAAAAGQGETTTRKGGQAR